MGMGPGWTARVVLQRPALTQVCASLEVSVQFFRILQEEKKNVVSIWYLHRILEGVDGFNYKC